MSNPLISILMKQTQHLMQKHDTVSDGELLHQYVTQRDQAGFAGLVRRHGPMVWAVCRNALRAESDAEDAFQAVFLALVPRRQANQESGFSRCLAAWRRCADLPKVSPDYCSPFDSRDESGAETERSEADRELAR